MRVSVVIELYKLMASDRRASMTFPTFRRASGTSSRPDMDSVQMSRGIERELSMRIDEGGERLVLLSYIHNMSK